MQRDIIVTELLNLAKEIAEKRHSGGASIERLVDELVPDIEDEEMDSIVVDAVESWAYTWLDVLQGAIKESEISRGDVFCKLIKLPLEDYITTL